MPALFIVSWTEHLKGWRNILDHVSLNIDVAATFQTMPGSEQGGAGGAWLRIALTSNLCRVAVAARSFHLFTVLVTSYLSLHFLHCDSTNASFCTCWSKEKSSTKQRLTYRIICDIEMGHVTPRSHVWKARRPVSIVQCHNV